MLVEDHGIDYPGKLVSLSDDNITAICDEIRRTGGLVSRSMLNRHEKMFVLVAENLKFALFMFRTMEHFSKSYISHVGSWSVLNIQIQWELEQKK